MVESQPSKLLVAGPIPVSRSIFSYTYGVFTLRFWSGMRVVFHRRGGGHSYRLIPCCRRTTSQYGDVYFGAMDSTGSLSSIDRSTSNGLFRGARRPGPRIPTMKKPAATTKQKAVRVPAVAATGGRCHNHRPSADEAPRNVRKAKAPKPAPKKVAKEAMRTGPEQPQQEGAGARTDPPEGRRDARRDHGSDLVAETQRPRVHQHHRQGGHEGGVHQERGGRAHPQSGTEPSSTGNRYQIASSTRPVLERDRLLFVQAARSAG